MTVSVDLLAFLFHVVIYLFFLYLESQFQTMCCCFLHGHLMALLPCWRITPELFNKVWKKHFVEMTVYYTVRC